MKKKHTLLLGAHISIADSLEKAFERGESIGCTTIQIFTKSNRQWYAKPITQEQADLFKFTYKSSTIKPVVVHASYLINLCSPDQDTEKKSITALIEELERCEQLGISLLVLHPGSHGKNTQEDGLQKIITNIDYALEHAKSSTQIALEIMAGQGTQTCSTFERLSYVINSSRYKDRLGVCFDTCHAFAAGYDFRDTKSYSQLWSDFDDIIGLEKLKVIHVNDSKKECGSHIDRHENIGKGELGLEPFRLLFNDKRFFDIPKILETPGDDLNDYAQNMTIITHLISPENKTT